MSSSKSKKNNPKDEEEKRLFLDPAKYSSKTEFRFDPCKSKEKPSNYSSRKAKQHGY